MEPSEKANTGARSQLNGCRRSAPGDESLPNVYAGVFLSFDINFERAFATLGATMIWQYEL